MSAVNGWICPKCGKSLAPWVTACDCSKKEFDLNISRLRYECDKESKERCDFDEGWKPV